MNIPDEPLPKTNMQLAWEKYRDEETVKLIFRAAPMVANAAGAEESKKFNQRIVEMAFFSGWCANQRRVENALYRDSQQNEHLAGIEEG